MGVPPAFPIERTATLALNLHRPSARMVKAAKMAALRLMVLRRASRTAEASHEPPLRCNADFLVGRLAGWKTGVTETPRFMVPMRDGTLVIRPLHEWNRRLDPHGRLRKAIQLFPARLNLGANKQMSISSRQVAVCSSAQTSNSMRAT